MTERVFLCYGLLNTHSLENGDGGHQNRGSRMDSEFAAVASDARNLAAWAAASQPQRKTRDYLFVEGMNYRLGRDSSYAEAAALCRMIFGAKNTGRSSWALTRPKLGFELSPGEEKCQIGEAGPVGERCEFASQFGNIGRSGVRTFDNLSDFNRFRRFFSHPTPAQAAR